MQTKEHGGAMATDKQEAEAWYFQSMITGLALGSYAAGRVTSPRGTPEDAHEDAWRFV